MRVERRLVWRSLCGALFAALAGEAAAAAPAEAQAPGKVEIRRTGEGYQLLRNGQPYFIRGAVYSVDPSGRFPIEELAARGANSVRSSDRRTLDAAHALGMTALVNLPVKMESAHGFDYSDERAVGEQFERVKARVLELKDHPAVLMWVIGNELSVNYTNRRVWNAVNDIARMIHSVDPNHPAMTIVGDGFVNGKNGDIAEILQRCPDLDLLGVNFYQGLEEVPARLTAEGWTKPYVITEWGPSGDWQVPKTAWKASIEESSSEKAERYAERYRNGVLKDAARCLGSYVFIWTWRHERTQTWYGMFLESGERTEAVNVMEQVWTGRPVANHAPVISSLTIGGRAALENVTLPPGSAHVAALEAKDPEGDAMKVRWEIVAEVARSGYAGMGEKRSAALPQLLGRADSRELRFTAPAAVGEYRLFVFVTDGHGNGATANIPFAVRP